jgi:hypothetical protein
MSKWMLLAVLLSGCGHRSFLDLVEATATRDTDDHVVVKASLTCETMMGTSCDAFEEYCVEARWERAGAAVDAAKSCSRSPLGAAASVVTIRSSKPIPRGDTTITLAMTWTGSGTSQSRNKLAAHPLSSP